MNAESFHISVQGASHIECGKECQDASASYCDERYSIAIVCDGHGGNDYIRSAAGSEIGCAVAQRNIREFLDGTEGEKFFQETEKRLRRLEESIISAWNEDVKHHYALNPFSEEELSGISEKARGWYQQGRDIEHAYGTTMIAVAMTREYWFGIHIGDGKCVTVSSEGVFAQPIPWDSKCFLNSTTSICDMDAIDNFRHFYSEELPVAIFVGSDGIDDCFSNDEQLNNLYKTVLYSFSISRFEEAVDSIKDYLPRLSARGSEDDVSIAAILDMELVSGLEIVKSFDREKEKARLQEKAKAKELACQEEKDRMEELIHYKEKDEAEEKATSDEEIWEEKGTCQVKSMQDEERAENGWESNTESIEEFIISLQIKSQG